MVPNMHLSAAAWAAAMPSAVAHVSLSSLSRRAAPAAAENAPRVPVAWWPLA
jgi:hypothetical protein